MVFMALTANFIVSNGTEEELDMLSDQRWTRMKPGQNMIAQSSRLALGKG
jgi:hypothetical protein